MREWLLSTETEALKIAATLLSKIASAAVAASATSITFGDCEGVSADNEMVFCCSRRCMMEVCHAAVRHGNPTEPQDGFDFGLLVP